MRLPPSSLALLPATKPTKHQASRSSSKEPSDEQEPIFHSNLIASPNGEDRLGSAAFTALSPLRQELRSASLIDRMNSCSLRVALSAQEKGSAEKEPRVRGLGHPRRFGNAASTSFHQRSSSPSILTEHSNGAGIRGVAARSAVLSGTRHPGSTELHPSPRPWRGRCNLRPLDARSFRDALTLIPSEIGKSHILVLLVRRW